MKRIFHLQNVGVVVILLMTQHGADRDAIFVVVLVDYTI
ncbi:uncharacterized protein METZ01_LOCUS84578 [marine metagenome]|uniref:Uncharacterized protein n=1 Tax=marine metagenome TaxID=408172 RepID=A0A381UUT0_9ZZZZ